MTTLPALRIWIFLFREIFIKKNSILGNFSKILDFVEKNQEKTKTMIKPWTVQIKPIWFEKTKSGNIGTGILFPSGKNNNIADRNVNYKIRPKELLIFIFCTVPGSGGT